jgi:hypothetical protein
MTPATEAAKDAAPLAEHLGQVAPGEPVRTIHNTASTNMRLWRPDEPLVRSSPMM